MTRDHADRVRAVFGGDDLAARYGATRFPPRRMNRERRTLGTLLCDLLPGDRLDLACGAGRFGDLLAPGGAVTGLDASAPMLREAAQTGAYARLVQGDAFRLPFRDGAFAAAICIRLLQHFDAGDRRKVLTELRRTVTGRAVVSFFDSGTIEAWRARGRRAQVRSRRAVPLAEFTSDCESSGWRVVRVARKLGRLTEHVFVLLEPITPTSASGTRTGALAEPPAPRP